jgi:hypothetical protein
MRHVCDKWGPQPDLAQLIFLAVRYAFHSRRHPDQKRQRTTRKRDLYLWGARKVKGCYDVRHI